VDIQGPIPPGGTFALSGFGGTGTIGATTVASGVISAGTLTSPTGIEAFPFGTTGDRPVPADYDGDGEADAAVYRNGIWYYLRSTAGFGAVSFGVATDKPIPSAFN
jgi:hypothetical protein